MFLPECLPAIAATTFIGDPPSDYTFVGLDLKHGDALRATATWANAAGQAATLSSPGAVMDLLPPTVSGAYGPLSGSVDLQSSDNLVFTVSAVQDATSGIEALRVRADVLVAPSAQWRETCEEEVGVPVMNWTNLPVRVVAPVGSLGVQVGHDAMCGGEPGRVWGGTDSRLCVGQPGCR